VSRDFEIRRGGVEDIDSLRPLWQALWSHHGALPAMRPVRTAEDSWAYRSRQYREWQPIGYAVLSIGGDTASWDVGDKTAEIETLSVAESERGSGVGKALIDAVQEVADAAGAGAVVVGVAHSNADAIRFYEREGFSDFYVLLMKP
jgi:ribosomal protein S18 acetylase RimI-like enzyme